MLFFEPTGFTQPLKSFIRKTVIWLQLPLAAATGGHCLGEHNSPRLQHDQQPNLSHCKEGKTAMNLGRDPKSDLGGQGLNNCAEATVSVNPPTTCGPPILVQVLNQVRPFLGFTEFWKSTPPLPVWGIEAVSACPDLVCLCVKINP